MGGCLTCQKHQQYFHDRQFQRLDVHSDEHLAHLERHLVLNLERHLDEDHRNRHDLGDRQLAWHPVHLDELVHRDEVHLRLGRLDELVHLDAVRLGVGHHRLC
jgi:hypothetical protein